MTTYTVDVADRYYGPPQSVLQTAFDAHGDATCTSAEHEILECNVFYPQVAIAGAMPVGGWPVVLYTVRDTVSSTGAARPTTVTPSEVFPHACLEKGLAVVWATMPVARGGASGNGVGPETFDPSFGQWGTQYRGNGVMPEQTPNDSITWPGPLPGGYAISHSTRPNPWLDPLWLNGPKAAMWLVQHIRYHGLEGQGVASQKLNLHPGRVGAFSEGAGASYFAWPAYQANRAGLTGDTSPQGQMNTRLNAVALRNANCHWIVDSDTAPPAAHMFPQKQSVSGNNDHDLPAAAMDDVDDSPFDLRVRNAADWFGAFGGVGAQADVGDSGLALNNIALKAWWSSDTAMDATLLGTASRYVVEVSGFETDLESAYHAYRTKARLQTNTTLVIEDAGAVDPNPASGSGVAADKTIFTGVADVYEDAATWLDDCLELDIPVEEVVIRKVESVLAAITFANGATTDVKAVYRFEDMPEDVPLAPCVMIDAMDTLYDDGFTNQVMRKTFSLDITLFLEGWKNQMSRLSSFMADVEKALYADETLDSLVENLHIERGRRHLLNPEMHEYAVAELSVDVIFRHAIGDPFTPYPN